MKLIAATESKSWVPGGHAKAVSRQIVSAGDGAQQVEVHTSTIAPGGGSKLERHPESEQVFMLLSGELTFIDADQHELLAGPGAAVFVPANIWHATENRGTVEAVCLVITAPPIH